MQNKQQLINWLTSQRDACDELHQDDCQREQCCANRIALEKLTAPEPVPVAWCYENGPFGRVATCSEKVAARWSECNDFKVTPFYSAPAVLADVLPGDSFWGVDIDKKNCFVSSDKVSGWNAYRAEILRRINLIESGKWKIVPTECSESEGFATKALYRSMIAAAPEFK